MLLSYKSACVVKNFLLRLGYGPVIQVILKSESKPGIKKIVKKLIKHFFLSWNLKIVMDKYNILCYLIFLIIKTVLFETKSQKIIDPSPFPRTQFLNIIDLDEVISSGQEYAQTQTLNFAA